jgi:DNA polymerase IV
LRARLSQLSDRVCERLRKKHLMARSIGIKIRRADFSTFTRRRVVAPPTHDGRTIASVAHELLARWLIQNKGEKLRLLGVVLSDLSTASQLGLFEDTSSPHTSRLDAALDEARARFGSRALRRGNAIK